MEQIERVARRNEPRIGVRRGCGEIENGAIGRAFDCGQAAVGHPGADRDALLWNIATNHGFPGHVVHIAGQPRVESFTKRTIAAKARYEQTVQFNRANPDTSLAAFINDLDQQIGCFLFAQHPFDVAPFANVERNVVADILVGAIAVHALINNGGGAAQRRSNGAVFPIRLEMRFEWAQVDLLVFVVKWCEMGAAHDAMSAVGDVVDEQGIQRRGFPIAGGASDQGVVALAWRQRGNRFAHGHGAGHCQRGRRWWWGRRRRCFLVGGWDTTRRCGNTGTRRGQFLKRI